MKSSVKQIKSFLSSLAEQSCSSLCFANIMKQNYYYNKLEQTYENEVYDNHEKKKLF